MVVRTLRWQRSFWTGPDPVLLTSPPARYDLFLNQLEPRI
jgi:hypothetical protein